MSVYAPARPEKAEIAVVIVNYRTPQLTMRCVQALRGEKELLPNLRVVVVDGGSGDGSAEALMRDLGGADYRGWVSFLPLEINGGFGWANNQAILTLARSDTPPQFIHLLNPDAEVAKGAVAALVEELQTHQRCGAAGSQLIDPDGHPAASAFRFPSAGRELINAAQSEKLGRTIGIASTVVEARESLEVDWVTGASVLLRSEALRQTGLFDDGFFLYFDEVELMHRLRARGWSICHVPESRVVHAEGASTGLGAASVRALPAYWYRSRLRYFALTGGYSAAMSANLARLGGRAVAMLKSIFGKKQRRDPARTADLVRFGFWPAQSDLRPSVPAWGDAPGAPPAWMAHC
jgi:N-acetylglucosaminyl-diphospho-decaprenol L-rhamnosyltransferase